MESKAKNENVLKRSVIMLGETEIGFDAPLSVTLSSTEDDTAITLSGHDEAEVEKVVQSLVSKLQEKSISGYIVSPQHLPGNFSLKVRFQEKVFVPTL